MQELFSTQNKTDLSRCEEIIERGLKAFYEVGSALMEIRDKRLYREEFKTFEEYCRVRWGMSRIQAHRLIKATEVYEVLLPAGNILPLCEAHVRPLTKLESPEDQIAAWNRALETAPNGGVTETVVKNAVCEIILEPELESVGTVELEPVEKWAEKPKNEVVIPMKRITLDKREGPMFKKLPPKFLPDVNEACESVAKKISGMYDYVEGIGAWLDHVTDDKAYYHFMLAVSALYRTTRRVVMAEGFLYVPNF